MHASKPPGRCGTDLLELLTQAHNLHFKRTLADDAFFFPAIQRADRRAPSSVACGSNGRIDPCPDIARVIFAAAASFVLVVLVHQY